MRFTPDRTRHEHCTATREYVGPFPVTTTHHHLTCTDRTDKEMRTR